MFRLLRYFSIASLIAFLPLIFVLGIFYRQTTVDVLVKLEGEKNIALAQALANSIYADFQSIIAKSEQMDENELRSSPSVDMLHQVSVEQSRGLPVVKIKIYRPDGLTIFSTDPAQIGENQAENAGFQSALNKQAISSLVHRDTFNAFDMVLEDRDLIQSYIPIYSRDPDQQVIAVFELYSDVTQLLQQIQRTQLNVILFVIAVLALLYGILYLIVRRADGIIRSQYQALEQAKSEITLARDQALRANQFKTRLLENVSHDLRTPLSAIMGYVDLLSDEVYGPINERQVRTLNRIQLSIGHLTDLINDLLKQGQIDAEQLTLNFEPFQLADLVKNVQNHMRLPAENKGLETEVKVHPDVPEEIHGDLLHLTQIINNLTGNAIKFTDQGLISVNFTCPSPGQWRVSVSDTGPGIPSDKIDQLFDPFQKLANPQQKAYEGMGLGLSIVKQLVTLMDGEIDVESQPDHGSRFTITFPMLSEVLHD
jgi:signal transduction histidine kinase